MNQHHKGQSFLLKLLHNYWPIVLLLVITGIFAVINYSSGTYLTGWDNLHPEFSPWMNIKRSIFAVWQEYQGLGLLGGMGHASALPRDIFVLVLSLILPQSLIRYTLTFVMLGLGGVGTYLLAFDLIRQRQLNQTFLKSIAFLSGLYVMVSPLVQHLFAVPFEAFIVHLAALPFLIWSARRILTEPNKKHILLFILINIVLTTQAYIPTLFVTYFLILTILLVSHLLLHHSKQAIISVFLVLFITGCTNGSWFLPFIYFTKTNSEVTINAKINQMSTDTIFLRNKSYGTFHNIIMQQSFWIDTYDYSPGNGQTVPILTYWLSSKNRADYLTIGYSVAFVIFIGLIGILLKKRKESYFLLPILLLCLLMIVTDTPPFSLIGTFLRDAVPLFNQAFRFPFTKWGIATVWIMSLLFAMGITQILEYNMFRNSWKKAFMFLFFIPIVWYGYPFITRQLFYPAMQQQLPQSYTDLFTYMKTKPAGRIANLPQYTYWGWSYNRWGYTGSGFPWYGIEQPILDRAFDVWSNENENYYWELSYAMYAKNSQLLANILNKYDIQYILYDKTAVSPAHNRALLDQEITALLKNIDTFHIDQEFGEIMLLSRKLPQSHHYVSVHGKLPTVMSEQWTDNDNAYTDVGIYITNSQENNIYYPFRSLFTKRSVSERSFSITEGFDGLTLTSDIIPTSYLTDLYTKNYISSVEASESAVTIENQRAVISNNSINNVYKSDFINHLTATNVVKCGNINSGSITSANTFDSLKFETTDQKACLSFLVNSLEHKYGYLVQVRSKHIQGQPMLFSLVNQTAKHTEIEAYLPSTTSWETSYFILPPLAIDGLGYNIYLANESIGREKTINELGEIQIFQIPYEEMMSYKFVANDVIFPPAVPTQPTFVSHPNPSYYLVQKNTDQHNLILYQGFDPGWKAYEVDDNFLSKGLPFIFGKELKNHVLINNWANGWEIPEMDPGLRRDDKREIVVFFLPQLLQWFGFLLLPLPFISLLIRNRKTH